MTDFDLGNGITLKNVHSSDLCAGRPCVIHNSSDHPYRDLPLTADRRGWVYRQHVDGPILDPDTAGWLKINVLRNSARCLKCNSSIQSMHVHDFKSCQCGNVFVDGGFEYVRHGFEDHITYVDTSIYLAE